MISALLLFALSLPAAHGGAPLDYDQAVSDCEQGEAHACVVAGSAAATGTGVPFDKIASTDLLSRGCELGSDDACVRLGWTYLNHQGYIFDPKRAGPLWEAACKHGHAFGCMSWGRWLSSDYFGDYDPARAGEAFQRACDAGYPSGCHRLGQQYWRGTARPVDTARARALFQQSCDAGIDRACADLGLMTQLGQGAPADPDGAAQIYRATCEQDSHSQACGRLGLLLLAGHKVEIGRPAAELLRRAALGPEAAGRLALALALLEGRLGIQRDEGRAYTMLAAVCDLDGERTVRTYEEALACQALAQTEATGRFGQPEAERLQHLRAVACAGGVGETCAPPAEDSPSE